jgi:hypothetical protein
MSDLNDELRRDGDRWREEVDHRHALDPDQLFDHITSGPIVATPARGRHDRFSGRTSVWLSVAAVTAAALAIGGGIVLASSSHHAHHAPPVLGVVTASPAASLLPSARPSSAARPSANPSPSAYHASSEAAPATSHVRHPHRSAHPVSRSTSSSAAVPTCDNADLGISVSSPASAGDHTSMTVSLLNHGSVPCAVSGFPAVQFTGDSTVSATPTAGTAALQTIAAGATATAEVDWDGTSATGTCTSYAAAEVSAPGGVATQLQLDPPAQLCDASTFMAHPFAAS